MKRLLLFILVVFVPVIVTAGIKGSMTGIGVGARGMVLQGGFSAAADDYSVNFWNPAGSGMVNRLQFGAMLMRLPWERNVSYVGPVYPINAVDRIGVGWTGFYIDNLEARSGNSELPDYLFGSNDQTFLLSYARQIVKHFSIGVNTKLLYHSLADAVALGYSFDLGLLYAKPDWRVGLTLHDFSSELRWQTGQVDRIERIAVMAGSYQFDHLLLAAGINGDLTDAPELRFSCGAEFDVQDQIFIRTGFYDKQLAMGLGVRFNYQTVTAGINYAVRMSRISNDLAHGLELALVFDQVTGAGSGRQAAKERKPERAAVTATDKKKPDARQAERLTPKPQVVVKVLGDRVNVRLGPGVQFVSIGKALRNQIFVVLDVEADNGWVKIEFNGRIGWIGRSYVEILR